MHDYVPTFSAAAERYNHGRMQALREALDRALAPTSEAALAEAARLGEARRGLLARIEALRDAGRLTGSTALTLVAATHFAHPGEYLEPLAAWVETAEAGATEVEGARVLLVAADPVDDLFVHHALERAGTVVVAEDSWWGSRAAGPPLGGSGDIRDAIDARLRGTIAGRDISPRSERESWIRDRIARGDLDAIVFHIPPSDLLFGWDYPKLKRLAEAQGIATLLLTWPIDSQAGRDSLASACVDFFNGGIAAVERVSQ
jgi:benzoyl-CoA reductase/2-hydroxyglutaryl-CoA dehydratase subunit BcrC/BadD/HgdB